MTRYPIPTQKEMPSPAVNAKKEKRKKQLEEIYKRRAEILKRVYKRQLIHFYQLCIPLLLFLSLFVPFQMFVWMVVEIDCLTHFFCY